MEVYESHLGGIYFTDEVCSFDDLYCEVCGDSDLHLGHADTWEEVIDLIIDVNGWCPYTKDYLAVLKARFEVEREDE